MEDGFLDDNGGTVAGVDMGAGEGPEDRHPPAEQELEEFTRILAGLRRHLPLLRRLAPLAARTVLGELDPETLDEDEADLEQPGESEAEAEDEDVVPGLSAEDEALAEALAAAAAVATGEEEAAGLVGGVTILILGPAPIRIRRLTPVLVRRATRLVRLLRRSPATRPLVPVVSTITKATTRRLVRRAAAGRPVTPAVAVGTMARQTARTLGRPRRIARALARNRAQRRRLDPRAIARVER